MIEHGKILKNSVTIDNPKIFQSKVTMAYFNSTIISKPFISHIPLDKKFKIENLFEFNRKDGDFFLSFLCLCFVIFLLLNFTSETGWEDRILDHKRFGKILKQPWVGPLGCISILLPAAILNLFLSFKRWSYKSKNLIPGKLSYELSIWIKALEYVAYFLIYTISITYLGYFLSTIIFGVYLTNRLGYNSLKWQIRTIIATLMIVLTFRTFLQIKTPINIWLYEFFPQNIETFMKIHF